MAPPKVRRGTAIARPSFGSPPGDRTVKVRSEIFERLLNTGTMRESMDTLMDRLIREHEELAELRAEWRAESAAWALPPEGYHSSVHKLGRTTSPRARPERAHDPLAP